MKLIIGLGNPGEKYQNNRHNAGAMLTEFLKMRPPISTDKERIIADTTGVYMNESGRVVKKLIDFYKILPQNLYLVYDDLDIPLGSYKIVQGRGPRLHNGVESVKNALGTENFWHVRIGVEGRDRGRDRVSGKDYVLQNFTEEEKRRLKEVIGKI